MNRFLLIATLALLPYYVFSQSDDVRKMSFGVYGGGNISQLLTDSVNDTKARIGYQYGAFIRYGGNFFLRGDVALFAMSSQLVDANDTTQIIGIIPEIEDKIDIQFIHIPVQLGLKIFHSPDGTSALWVAAGGYIDQIYNVKNNQLGLTKQDFNTTSFGVLGTAGLDLWFLTFQLSYQHGLTPIFKMDDQSVKYNLSLSAGIKF